MSEADADEDAQRAGVRDLSNRQAMESAPGNAAMRRRSHFLKGFLNTDFSSKSVLSNILAIATDSIFVLFPRPAIDFA